jgi:adenylate cyclase
MNYRGMVNRNASATEAKNRFGILFSRRTAPCKRETRHSFSNNRNAQSASLARIAPLCSLQRTTGAIALTSHVTDADDFDLRVETTTIMFADVVESVRLIEHDEQEAISCIRGLLAEIAERIVPAFGGRTIERRGDGVLATFASVSKSAGCAVEIHKAAALVCGVSGLPLSMRVALHRSDIWTDGQALYGKAMNLVARLVTLAEPGETVVSASAKESLTLGVDLNAEDLGECYLRHVASPVHCYRLRCKTTESLAAVALLPEESPLPKLAIMPFRCIDAADQKIARVFTKLLTGVISKSSQLHVVSSLSMQTIDEESLDSFAVRRTIGADWVLKGDIAFSGKRASVSWKLGRLSEDTFVCGSTDFAINSIVDPQSDSLLSLAMEVARKMLARGLELSSTQPIASLPSNIVLLGAIALMHRGGSSSDQEAARLLHELMERHKRSAIPYAWAAKQAFLRLWRGWSNASEKERALARQYADQSVHKGAAIGLPYAVRAMVASHIDRRFDESRDWYRQAIEVEPNEPLTWIFKCALHTFEGEGEMAANCARRAISLSPLDPLSYYYKTLAGGAFVANDEYDIAIRLTEEALNENKHHHSTYRVLAIAYGLNGQHEKGHCVIKELLRVDPNFSISLFLRNSPARNAEHYAKVLKELGAPTN